MKELAETHEQVRDDYDAGTIQSAHFVKMDDYFPGNNSLCCISTSQS
ncbi:DUF4025 domain-containing protein [Metabacillus mangrovi]